MIAPERIREKLTGLQLSLETMHARLQKCRVEQDEVTAQINAHIGAIQALEELLGDQPTTPVVDESPVVSEEQLKQMLGADSMEVVDFAQANREAP